MAVNPKKLRPYDQPPKVRRPILPNEPDNAATAFLVAAIHHPAKRWAAHVYGFVIGAIALGGASVATRHVWLQYTPEAKRPACGPGLEFLLNTFGPIDSIRRILTGSGECGKVDWTLLGLSIPEWTLAASIAFAAYAVFLSFRD